MSFNTMALPNASSGSTFMIVQDVKCLSKGCEARLPLHRRLKYCDQCWSTTTDKRRASQKLAFVEYPARVCSKCRGPITEQEIKSHGSNRSCFHCRRASRKNLRCVPKHPQCCLSCGGPNLNELHPACNTCRNTSTVPRSLSQSKLKGKIIDSQENKYRLVPSTFPDSEASIWPKKADSMDTTINEPTSISISTGSSIGRFHGGHMTPAPSYRSVYFPLPGYFDVPPLRVDTWEFYSHPSPSPFDDPSSGLALPPIQQVNKPFDLSTNEIGCSRTQSRLPSFEDLLNTVFRQ